MGFQPAGPGDRGDFLRPLSPEQEEEDKLSQVTGDVEGLNQVLNNPATGPATRNYVLQRIALLNGFAQKKRAAVAANKGSSDIVENIKAAISPQYGYSDPTEAAPAPKPASAPAQPGISFDEANKYIDNGPSTVADAEKRSTLQYSMGGGPLKDYNPNGASREARLGIGQGRPDNGPAVSMMTAPENIDRVTGASQIEDLDTKLKLAQGQQQLRLASMSPAELAQMKAAGDPRMATLGLGQQTFGDPQVFIQFTLANIQNALGRQLTPAEQGVAIQQAQQAYAERIKGFLPQNRETTQSFGQ